MKKTIYNVYVLMESQEQCDRMKKICLDFNLPIWDKSFSFEFLHDKEVFGFDNKSSFFVMDKLDWDCLEYMVTEDEFIKLLEKGKNGKLESRD